MKDMGKRWKRIIWKGRKLNNRNEGNQIGEKRRGGERGREREREFLTH